MQIVNVWVLWTYVSRIVTWGYDDLSSSKPTNQYRSSGSCPNCYANYAVDRNISTCMRTGDIGFTSGSNKTTWWYVDLGGLKSVGNIRIQFKDYGVEYIQRQMGRFSGFSLYVSNTTDRHSGYLCYKNGPDLGLPPLDFNTNCIVHGRYVIFYNERLPGTQYPIGFSTHGVITELCEVTVTGCSTGVYGESCDKHCPDNCMEHACDVINGTCLKCLPGWVGHFCDKGCSRHNIIENKCDMPCPDNCQEDRCNILNGTCEDCSPGFLGQYCNKTCKNGMYGINCKYRCSGHCLNNDTCNFITGFCNNGCSIGYLGDMCNETCNVGYFGMHCTQSCSPSCLYGVCRHYDGACTCKPGWSGSPYCNITVTETNGPSDNDNESSYIAGLSFLIIINISLVVAFLFFVRRYNKLVKKMLSLQYATITMTPPQQNNNSNYEQHYQELSVAETAYHNLSLTN